MGRKKQSGNNTNQMSGKENKAKLKKSMQEGSGVPDIVLGEFDVSYLQMLSDTAGQSQESMEI